MPTKTRTRSRTRKSTDIKPLQLENVDPVVPLTQEPLPQEKSKPKYSCDTCLLIDLIIAVMLVVSFLIFEENRRLFIQ